MFGAYTNYVFVSFQGTGIGGESFAFPNALYDVSDDCADCSTDS